MPPRRKSAAPPPRRKLGSVIARPGGKWEARLDLGRIDGKRRRVSRWADSERDAELKLAELVTKHGRGLLAPPKQITVASWLDEHLARRAVTRQQRASTIKEAQHVSGLIKRALGHRRLTELSAAHFQAMIDSYKDYAPRTRRRLLYVLSGACNEAVALGVLNRNPAAVIEAPRNTVQRKKKAWNKEQGALFLLHTRGHMWHGLFRLLMAQGLRQGEALALRLEDYDPQAGTLNVTATLQYETPQASRRTVAGLPKTQHSMRLLTLPRDLNAALKEHLEARRKLLEKAASAGLLNDQGWLFCSAVGTLIGQRNLARTLDSLINQVNDKLRAEAEHQALLLGRSVQAQVLPRTTPHGLRYTFINVAKRRGLDLDEVAGIVGHRDATVTAQRYREIEQQDRDSSNAALEGLFDD